MTFSELVFIMVLGLILFGPEELPKIAKAVGKIIYEVKQASTDVQKEVRKVIVDQPPKNESDTTSAHSDQSQEQDITTDKQNLTN